MQGKRLLAALTAALMLAGASGPAFGQQPAPKPAPGMPMDQGMMGGGMMGNMNMMHECQRMMRGAAMDGGDDAADATGK
jgi:Spy/CpxP family protein refolding chaperone